MSRNPSPFVVVEQMEALRLVLGALRAHQHVGPAVASASSVARRPIGQFPPPNREPGRPAPPTLYSRSSPSSGAGRRSVRPFVEEQAVRARHAVVPRRHVADEDVEPPVAICVEQQGFAVPSRRDRQDPLDPPRSRTSRRAAGSTARSASASARCRSHRRPRRRSRAARRRSRPPPHTGGDRRSPQTASRRPARNVRGRCGRGMLARRGGPGRCRASRRRCSRRRAHRTYASSTRAPPPGQRP